MSRDDFARRLRSVTNLESVDWDALEKEAPDPESRVVLGRVRSAHDLSLRAQTTLDMPPPRRGALRRYLRMALKNRVEREIRTLWVVGPREAYKVALASLSPGEREAILARIELGGSYEDVARTLGVPTAYDARIAVRKALLSLSKARKEESDHPGTRGKSEQR